MSYSSADNSSIPEEQISEFSGRVNVQGKLRFLPVFDGTNQPGRVQVRSPDVKILGHSKLKLDSRALEIWLWVNASICSREFPKSRLNTKVIQAAHIFSLMASF